MIKDFCEKIGKEVKEIVENPDFHPLFAPPRLKDASLLYPLNIGKALRPSITVLVCECLGGDRQAALVAGTAIELYHNSTLVHDDIIDNDNLRRGKSSVHAKFTEIGRDEMALLDNAASHYGLTMGILAGDMLQSWAAYLLTKLPDFGVDDAVTMKIIRSFFGSCSASVLSGETVDIELPLKNIEDITLEMVFEVILNKTAALFGCSAYIGGLIAVHEDDERVNAAVKFALNSGIAFQIKDDILGIIGSEKSLGKPIGSDITEGKRTYILLKALELSDEDSRQYLLENVGSSELTVEKIQHIKDIFISSGAISSGEELAEQYIKSARESLNILPNNESRELLFQLNELMIDRIK